MTEHLQKLLTHSNPHIRPQHAYKTAENLKENFCFVSQNFESEKNTIKERQVSYSLPDSNTILISKERIQCPEIMFKPLKGLEAPSVQEIVLETINKVDANLSKDIYNNIFLSGGNTMFEGFQERLLTEIEEKVSSDIKVQILAPIERKFSTWVGGSVLTSIPAFENHWITASQFEEQGESIIYRRLF